MTVVSYPVGLPQPVQASKSRSRKASFRVIEPRRGYAYTQKVGTDAPVVWSMTWVLSRDDAARMSLWVQYDLDGGINEFTMSIGTEFGPVPHTCKFLESGFMDATESGETVTFRATVMARTRVIPDDIIAARDLIVGLPNWRAYGSIIDVAVNSLWVEA